MSARPPLTWNRKGAGPAWDDGKGKGLRGKGRPASPWRTKGGGKGTKGGQQGQGNVPCPYFLKGACKFGDQCQKSHSK